MDKLTFKETCVSKDEFLAPTNTMDWPGEGAEWRALVERLSYQRWEEYGFIC